MNRAFGRSPVEEPTQGDRRGDVGDFLYLILKRRKFLFWNTAIVTLLVMAGSFLLPVRYRATTTLLPPEKGGDALLGLGPVLQSFDISRFSLTGVTSSAQVYLAILKSRTVADSLVQRFDLIDRYEVKNTEMARQILSQATEFRLTSTGIIQLSVEDEDPVTAADMANAFVTELDRINRTIRMGEGKRTRVFVEDRLEVTERLLRASEDSLLAFKQAHPGVILPEDLAASASAAANLMAQRIALGAELDVLRSALFSTAPALRMKEREVLALDRGLEDIPHLELELGRRFRDFKVQEKVFELLTAQVEEARIREARDITTVDVLDAAIPPIRKSFPRRSIMTVAAFVFSLVAGLILIVCLEALNRMKLAEDSRLRSLVSPGSVLDRVLFGRRPVKSPKTSS